MKMYYLNTYLWLWSLLISFCFSSTIFLPLCNRPIILPSMDQAVEVSGWESAAVKSAWRSYCIEVTHKVVMHVFKLMTLKCMAVKREWELMRACSHALLRGSFQALDEQNKGLTEPSNYVLTYIEYMIVLGKH
jgi:hypothetical protein